MALFWGIVFMIIGVAAWLFVGRRKFYRTNQSGIEQFRNYKSSVFNNLFETIVLLIGAGAMFFGFLRAVNSA